MEGFAVHTTRCYSPASCGSRTQGSWFSVDGLIAVIHGLDRNVLFLEEQWRCIASHTRDGNPAWKNRSWQAHEARLFGWMIRTLLAGAGDR